jgi:hypothetical protein
MSAFAFVSTFLDNENLLEQVRAKVKPKATNIKDPLNGGTSEHPLTLWGKADLAVATRMAANPNLLAGLSVIIQGELHPVTLIQSATQPDKMGDFFAAHLTNSLESAHPTYLPIDDACGYVISILSEGQAKKAKLVYNRHDMRLPFPDVSDPDEEVVVTAPDELLFKLPKLPPHLGTTQQGEDFKPVLVAVPKSVVFDHMDNPPQGKLGHDKTRTLCQDLEDSAGLPYHDALAFLREHYKGMSLHTLKGFPWSLLDKQFDENTATRLVNSIETEPAIILPTSADAKIITQQVAEGAKKCLERYYRAHPEELRDMQQKLQPSAGTNTTSRDTEATALAQAINRLVPARRAADDELSASSATVKFSINFYKILLMTGRQNPNGSGSYLFDVNVNLQPTILEAIQKIQNMHPEILNSQMNSHKMNLQDTEKMIYARLEYNPFNKAFLCMFRTSQWVYSPWDETTNASNNRLSIFNFVPTDTSSETYKNFVRNLDLVHMDDVIDQATEHKTKVDTKVLLCYEIRTWERMCDAIAMLNGVWLFGVANPHTYDNDAENQPFISVKYEFLLRILLQPRTVRWARAVIPLHPHIPYTIIIRVQNATALLCSAARNAALNAQAERGIAPEHIRGSEIDSFVTAIEAVADQVVRARECNDAGTFSNPPLTYSLHCASVKRKQQEDKSEDKNGKKKYRREDDGNADHGKQFGCLVLVDPNRAPNLRVNRPPLIRAGNRDGRPCYPFMTQGLTCTNRTTCTYLHVLDHLRGVEDRTPLLDWIAGEPTLEWAPGKKPSRSLSQGGSRSTPGNGSAPPQRHNPPPQQRGNSAPPPPAQNGAQPQHAARGGQQQRSTPPAPATPAAAAPPASGNPPRA